MEVEDEDDIISKVIIIGEEGVGKKSIQERFVKGIFRETHYMIGSSTHEEIPSKRMVVDEIQGKSVKFEIWVTYGGYHFLPSFYYRGVRIVILVYDITSHKSFEEIKKFWYNEIKKNCAKNISKYYIYFILMNLVIGLAGNKIDLYDKEQVSEAEARKYASEIGVVFKLTSALNGTGIEELFKILGRKIFDPNYIENENRYERKILWKYSNTRGAATLDAYNTKEKPTSNSWCNFY